MSICPICGVEGAQGPQSYHDRDMSGFECPRCGRYGVDGLARTLIPQESVDRRFRLSAVTRMASAAGRMIEIENSDLDRLIDSAPVWTSVFDGVDRLLLLLASRTDSFLKSITMNKDIDYPLLCAMGAKQMNELLTFAQKLDLLDAHHMVITPSGWRRVDELRRIQPKATQAFVAMWFAKEMDDVWLNGFKAGIEDTGYFRPFRIDAEEHNERIDDRIIASIRRSGLLVADFTGNRGGVYFEAGLAMGLGLPVIWTCRQDHVTNLHFDTRQYNHIVWTDVADLRRRLTDRIAATALPRNAA